MRQFRWWYLEIMSNDQIWVVILYDHPFYLSFPIFLVDITLYQKNKKFHVGIPYADNHENNIRGINSLQWVDGHFYQSHNRWNISLSHEKISLQLQIEEVVPCVDKTHYIYEKAQEYFFWKPLLPHGRISGEIQFRGKHYPINGHGYMDYNEGFGSLNKLVKSWSWRKKRSGEFVRIESDIILRNKKRVVIRESFGANDSNRNFNERISSLKGLPRIDQIYFYLTPIPDNFLLFRKIDEFLFYQIEEKFPENYLNRLRSNVLYRRYYKKTKNEEIMGEVIFFA